MYTLEDIYNRLNAGTTGSKRTGAFTEPTAGPTSGTGYTLDEVMGKAPTVDDTNGLTPSETTSGKTFGALIAGPGVSRLEVMLMWWIPVPGTPLLEKF